jgi:hypothetical protein
VNAIIQGVDEEVRDLERLLPDELLGNVRNTRRRRGLFNFGRHILKFLFGTATVSEVQRVHSILSRINHKNNYVIHAVEAQLTLLRTVDGRARQNALDLVAVAKSLKGTISQMIRINHTIRELHQARRIMEAQGNISTVMRNVEFSALRLQQKLIQLQEGIDVSSSGRLSSALVPPHSLSALLQQIV